MRSWILSFRASCDDDNDNDEDGNIGVVVVDDATNGGEVDEDIRGGNDSEGRGWYSSSVKSWTMGYSVAY
jgi:hypothetical protein